MPGLSAVGPGIVGGGSEWQVESPPEQEQDGPADEECHAVGEHQRDHGADAGTFYVFLGVADDEREVGHERCDDICAGVTDSVGGLCEFGGESKSHEHGDEDGAEEGPFGGGGADEKVDERGEQQDADDGDLGGRPEAGQKVRAFDREQDSDVGL